MPRHDHSWHSKRRKKKDRRSKGERRQDETTRRMDQDGQPKEVRLHLLYRTQICPRCKRHGFDEEHDGLDKHHILPKRHFKENGNHVWFCYRCHHEVVEKLIDALEGRVERRQLEAWEYFLAIAFVLRYPKATVSELVDLFVGRPA